MGSFLLLSNSHRFNNEIHYYYLVGLMYRPSFLREMAVNCNYILAKVIDLPML